MVIGGTSNAVSEITIATTTSGTGELNFTDTANTTNQASLSYDHSASQMIFTSAAVERMRLGNGVLYLKDTSNANMNIGLTLNQEAHDTEILSLKSSDVAHGITGFTETDTYGYFKKSPYDPASGGLEIAGLTDGGISAMAAIRSFGIHGGTPDATDTSSSVPVNMAVGAIKSGTSVTTVAAGGNLWGVGNNSTLHMLLKGNGDLHITNTTLIALDGEDDIGLVRAFQRSASDGLGMAMTEWDKHVTANEEDLRRVGVLSSTSDFVIQQRMNSLLGGSVWQLHVAQKEMQKVYEAEIAELKGQMNLLMEKN
jgi:hypothetical protein